MTKKHIRPFYRSLLVFAVVWNASLLAQSDEDIPDADQVPLQAQSAPPVGDVQELPPGITESMAYDWMSEATALANKPDHSFRSIWVRMFPLLTTPYGDPYPETQDINHVTIENSDGLHIYSLDTLKLLGTANDLRLDFRKSTFQIGKTAVKLEHLWIVPATERPTTLHWDRGNKTPEGRLAEVGVRLRGQFVIKPTFFETNGAGKPHFAKQQLWSVINVAKVNQYLNSVVPSEIIASWHPQTMRAQAIAARTYGMYEVAAARAKGSDWDVDPTTWFQSYRGVEIYNPATKRWSRVELDKTTTAVTATTGEIVTYKGEIIVAFFSANSGGKTCTVSECFGAKDLPYLKQAIDAAGIQNVAGGTWGTKANLSPRNILAKLKEMGIEPTREVVKLEPLERGPSGRIWRLRVRLKSGAPIDLDNSQTRKMMRLYGPIRSYLYALQDIQSDGKQGIVGHGYGHGVGLSQWGAQLFAKKGWDAHKILHYYYKNTIIKKVN